MFIGNLKLGQSDFIIKKITEEDINLFAQVSGDFNYIHVDKEKAKQSIFKSQIAHGMLTASLISRVIGTKLPGDGSIYLGQTLKFIKPVFIDDVIKSEVIITEIDKEKCIVKLETNCYNQSNDVVLKGEAKVKVRRGNR